MARKDYEELERLMIEELCFADCKDIGEAYGVVMNSRFKDNDYDVIYDILSDNLYFTTQEAEGLPHN